jgi:hypothetical protein
VQTARDADIAALHEYIATASTEDLVAADDILYDRQTAVLKWLDEFTQHAADMEVSPDQRLQISESQRYLAVEAATLAIQRRMMDTHLETLDDIQDPEVDLEDRVTFWTSITVEDGETVRDVVTFIGDIHIAGHVTEDVVAFGGDIHISPQGVVDGDVIALTGLVIDQRESPEPPDSDSNVPSDTSMTGAAMPPLQWAIPGVPGFMIRLLSIAGLGILTLRFAPARVREVAASIDRSPLRAGVAGLLTTVALLFAIGLSASTLVGLPLSAVFAAILTLAWLVGVMGLSEALGARLPMEHPHAGRWVVFGATAVLFALPFSSQGVLLAVALPVSAVAIGASLGTYVRPR